MVHSLNSWRISNHDPFFLSVNIIHLLRAPTRLQVSAEIFEAHAALGASASDLILPSSRKRNKSGDNVKKAAPALSAAEVKEAEFISKKQRRKLARCDIGTKSVDVRFLCSKLKLFARLLLNSILLLYH